MPQRGIPYVHMGRSIVLYSRSLFSIDICECLPMIQYIRLNEISNHQKCRAVANVLCASATFEAQCTGPWLQITVVTKFYTMTPNICGFTLWHLLNL